MATVAVALTKIYNVYNTLMHFIKLPFKKTSISKCSSLRPERLRFKMSLPMLKSSAGHFHKPICKSANCELKVLVCSFENRFLTVNICRFAVKKLKSITNPQIINVTGIVSAISYLTKSDCLMNHHLQSNILKGLWFT